MPTDNTNLFQTVFDSASNGIALLQPIYDGQGRVTDFSILLLNAFVLNWMDEVDYKGKKYTDVFSKVKPTGVLEEFIEIMETGITRTIERNYAGEGLNHWFRYTAVKQNDFLVVTIEDISERKQAEISLGNALEISEKQERLYDSITNNTPDLVYVFDLGYKFTYANKALLDMWGKSAEDAIGRGLRDNGYEEWHARMHENEIDEIIRTKKPIRGTVSFPHAELGSRVYDYILVPVIDERGNVEAIAGTTRDITEIKQAEKKMQVSQSRFRTVIDQTPAPTLVLMGDDLVIEQINVPMLQMIGQGEDAIGRPLIELLPELKGSYIWEQVLKVYHEGKHFDHPEVLVSHSRGGDIEDFYYNLSYRPLMEDGEIIGMIQVAVDVTEHVNARKKLEESESRYKKLSETLEQQVNDRTTQLQRSNQDLQQFAHVASHDLKEPVRKVKMFASRLEKELEGKPEQPATQFIEKINVAADRMSTMIDGVLAYSTANADMQIPEMVNLNDVMKSIEIDLEVALHKTGGQIHYRDLPTLEGAPVLLYQLFYNLINNSIKFSRTGTQPIIDISSEIVSKDSGDFAQITLKDNGIGFDPEQAERIFEAFTRLNSKDKYEGTGLGLSLCKKIVERHGGTIAAKGNAGQGAVFVIGLPMMQKEKDS
ncbi:MAG: PAS domain-containing sensor histidine kinase [Flavobacterium sp.]|uniref:PAS domain-containing sensor histidine kinase n=1 Tax=Flavobacterium sp. TaxID=239 RepID=UPI0012297920|nr:PAS domain-containing sensor histidine kinase [Flavobacterium sp.]RZJ65177.1 MAG: PAS domain-containing sensor histidine kinase [Flavobacterium sp.]